MADLQELFARLNRTSSDGASSPAPSQPGYRHPSVSAPMFSPSPHGPQPHHASAVLSPANTPAPAQPSQPTPQQQSAQLLNLLRFNAAPSTAQQSALPHQRRMHSAQVSPGSQGAENAGARTRQVSAAHAASATPVSAARSEQASAPAAKTQDLLLRLLNHPKPAQTDASRPSSNFATSPSSEVPETAGDDAEQASPGSPANGAANSPMRVFGSDGHARPTTFDLDAAAKPKFTYVNPFDKLEAASPRTRTPAPQAKSPTTKVEILKPKHGLDPSSSVSTDSNGQHTRKSRKLTDSAHPRSTVAEAVSDLGEQIGQQVEEALAEAEQCLAEAEAAKKVDRGVPDEVVKTEEPATERVVQIKKEEEEPVFDALKEGALEEAASEKLQADVADNWESAEAEAEAEDSPTKDDDKTVTVYTFPMKAFSSMQLDKMPEPRASFHPDQVLDIARLKKEFDQIDRSLVAASKHFIVYALMKKSGFRIVQQNTGSFRQVFENHQERIFNVALCTSPDQEEIESILGIGVNGSVYWTSLNPSREDQFSDDLDTQGLVLPPSPTQDDNTSGGQLKTRAKPSSRHPEYFAVGRGKSIHIVWPNVAAEYVRGGKGICQTEKYFQERSLKILTGKAGKDFTFSGDDTVIVSLDKAGRMRFWDIRTLTDPELGNRHNPPRTVEVSKTLLEFQTTSSTTKSWPTSVFFFDKDKPYNVGIAMRYVMVGMKQNHSFQLWDLGLGKAVHEINLPHEKESDAICSVAFHPGSSVMAVAHPTRNSIFFIHVSCPRYTLPPINQAVYIGRLASKDQLPAVTATAIMTSISEYSFAPRGQIRSLHMLNDPDGAKDIENPENTVLFDLYVMHSKGVCTIPIRRSDLGYKKDCEPLSGKDATEAGIITLGQIIAPPSLEESSNSGETSAPKSTSERSVRERESIKRENSNISRQSTNPEAAMRASTLAKVESKQDAARAALINGGEKSEKKKKKRASPAETSSQTSSTPRAPPSYAQAAQVVPVTSEPAKVEPAPSPKSVDTEPEWVKKLVSQFSQQLSLYSPPAPEPVDTAKLGEIVKAEVNKGISDELKAFRVRLDNERSVTQADHKTKQEELLRLVSATLTENVENVIRKMVEENVRDVLVPKILAQTSSTVDKSVSTTLKSALNTQLAKEMPDAVNKAITKPQFLNTFSDMVAKKVSSGVETKFAASTASVVNPAISTLATLIEKKFGEQLREAQNQRKTDTAKISQLTGTVQELTKAVSSMAATQAELQDQMKTLQQHLSTQTQATSVARPSPNVSRSPPKPQQKTPEQIETEIITRLMTEGNYEQGTMKWVQSNRGSDLFNAIFMNCHPNYLRGVTPLLNLSVGAVVTEALDQCLAERLVWLDAVLHNVDPNDPETRDVVPKIMGVMNQRLTAAYISLNEQSPGNQLLRHISSLITKVNELTRSASGQGHHLG